MKINITEKDISILKVVSQISGGFALIIAMTMIFSLIQLKTVKPLDNPALLSVKEQYDQDPANGKLAEQVRAMDLMARKAYFSYVNQGSLPGHDVQHWLEAEKQLLDERNLTRIHAFHNRT